MSRLKKISGQDIINIVGKTRKFKFHELEGLWACYNSSAFYIEIKINKETFLNSTETIISILQDTEYSALRVFSLSDNLASWEVK